MIARDSALNQMGLFNTLSTIPTRQLNWLIGTWAFTFRLFIFPLIDPKLFECLYSATYSRPATPPQVTMSLLLIQELFKKTDDEMHDWMIGGDLAIRFATNTLGLPLEDLPTCDKQLTRFRNRNREYAAAHNGENPMEKCLKNVEFGMWAMMGLDLKNVRMDSTQISANMARLSRDTLIYRANRHMLKAILANDESRKSSIEEANLEHYLEPYDENVVIYHSHESRASKRATLAKEASAILKLCTEDDLATPEGKLYTRILNEQTVVEKDVRRFADKNDDILHATNVQNLVDPDATCRTKAGKTYIGYVLNFAEAVGPFGSQIVSWDIEQNVTQDPVMAMAFLKEAQTITEGIERYNTLLGIENPHDMEKCQTVLQEKIDLVRQIIRDARIEGKKIPRSMELDPLYTHSEEENTGNSDDGYEQISLDELLSGFGICKQGGTGTSAETDVKSDSTVEVKTITEAVAESVESAPETTCSAPTENKATDREDETTVTKDPLSSTSDTVHKNEQEKSVENAEPKVVIIDGKCTIDGEDCKEYMKRPEFAELPKDCRRQALLHCVRDKQHFNMKELGEKPAMVVDGAYSGIDLQEEAAKCGFVLLPTDLLGVKCNPVLGLFDLDDEKKKVRSCPFQKEIVEQNLTNAGKIVLKMEKSACKNCPYRNDCGASWQPRKGVWKVELTPNAYDRVHSEAFLGDAQYKCVGRFRNGVETIPSLLHNVFRADDMPIGKAAKEFGALLKVGAVNIRKFFGFVDGKSSIKENPLLSRSF